MIDTDIKKFILRRLLSKNGEPLSSSEIKLAIRNAFSAALAEGDLDNYIRQLEEDNLISATSDTLNGLLWFLTPKGANRANQLVKT